MQQRLPKFYRDVTTAQAVERRRITERSLSILETIHRYHIIPTSLLVRLVEGNEDVTHRHLQALFHKGLINRFAFPSIFRPTENYHYLDNVASLHLLEEAGAHLGPDDYEEVQRNREKAYCDILDPKLSAESQGRLLFLHHEAMLTRMHAMLELAARASRGVLTLETWEQGAKLWQGLHAPKFIRQGFDEQGNPVWSEAEETEWLPHRPDGFFTLRIRSEAGEYQNHFLYEADRKTASTPKHNRKLRAHFHYICKQKKHQADYARYGVTAIRAVLVETLDMQWGETLRQAAREPIVSGNKPSNLFWFSASELLTKPTTIQQGSYTRQLPAYLTDPHLIFSRLWATPLSQPGQPLFSLLDR
jgi:hypothetical protein